MQANETPRDESLSDKQRYWLAHIVRCEAKGDTMVTFTIQSITL